MAKKTKLDFSVLDFWKYDATLFEQIFPELPKLLYENARHGWQEMPDLYKSYKHYNKVTLDQIKQNKGKSVSGRYWSEILGVSIANRTDMDCYRSFCSVLFLKCTLAKLYFASKYAKEDLLSLAKSRLDEILAGIEIPDNITINYKYDETNNLCGSYRYFNADVSISLYDEQTKIASNKVCLLHVSQNYDCGYHSNPSWDCSYKNEQNIRHMVKQFLADME